ncbi:unnamed protein product [Linum trigynum]|uniref:Uncharacterized protein n=1 Tax=Linum trigynum TaxID=586398 RepID=A0AAV2EQE8_9ROSI
MVMSLFRSVFFRSELALQGPGVATWRISIIVWRVVVLQVWCVHHFWVKTFIAVPFVVTMSLASVEGDVTSGGRGGFSLCNGGLVSVWDLGLLA